MVKHAIIFSIGLMTLYFSLVGVLNIYNDYDTQFIKGFVFAAILAVINIIITIFFIDFSLKKPTNEFVKIFLGTTILRLILVLTIFFTIVWVVSLNHFVFSVAFFILYFLFQIMEIYLLHTYKQSGKLK